jgi:hypothetical protein
MTLTQSKILSRRTFLRGMGVAITLPWLECMSPLSQSVANAGGISATERPKRAVFCMWDMGVNGRDYTPKTLTLHDGNRRAIDAAAKNLAMRLSKFDNLTPQEKVNTRKMEEALKANPDSDGYRFPVWDNGELRPPKPTDGPHLDAVMTAQNYFSGEPQLGLPAGRGWYRVKAVAYALKNDGKPARLKFTVHEGYSGKLPKAVSVFAFTDEQPREVEARYYLEPGDRVVFTIMDGAPHSQGRTMIDQPGPFIAIRSFSIEGPIYESWPPKGQRTLFGDIDPAQPTPEKAAAMAAHLAPRLFRRPVDDAAVAKYRALFETFAKTMKPDEALRGMLTAMLVSTRFLYHEEPPNGPDAYAIASRMSYFLWRSTPDDELLKAAADGSLLDATKRRMQAERMLADARAGRFVKDFTGQWLRVREVGAMKANAALYHNLSHHGQDEGNIAQLKRVERAFFDELKTLLTNLKNTKEGDATLLDRTTIVVTSNLGSGNSHSNKDLPVLLAGGRFQHGQHMAYAPGAVPLCNLYVSVLHQLGFDDKSFGTSTGALKGLVIS